LIYIKKLYIQFSDCFKEINSFSGIMLKITFQILFCFIIAYISANFAINFSNRFFELSDMIAGLEELIPAIAVAGVAVAFFGDIYIRNNNK